MNLPVSDLRKGNLVLTEYGILPVHHICFDDVYVKSKEGSVLYARKVEGIPIDENSVNLREQFLDLYEFAKPIFDKLEYIDFIHQAQNLYYWLANKDLPLTV